MKIYPLFIAIVSACIMSSLPCSAKQDTPEEALAAITAVYQAEDIDGFLALVDPEVLKEAGAKDKMTGIAQMSFGIIRQNDGLKAIEIVSQEVEGDTASLKTNTMFANGKSNPSSLDLVKRDGLWYLTIKAK